MGNFEDDAGKAKIRFVARLRRFMDRSEPRLLQKDIAEAIGTTGAAVSGIMRDPALCSEHIIRMVSLNFPEMGDAYKQYREFVDAPFLPNDDKEMSQKNSKGLARELAAVVRELERIGAEVLKKGKAKK